MASAPVAPVTLRPIEPLTHTNGSPKLGPHHAPDDGRSVSKADYWAHWYDRGDASYEWNDGYLEAKPLPNPVQFRLHAWFLMLVDQYLETYQNGQLMGLETGFSLTVPDPKRPGRLKETVRKPDLAVIRHDNPVVWGETERSYSGICDLCIESLSDSAKQEVERDTKVKKAEYEFVGVQEYYILDPSNQQMHFFQRTASGKYTEILPDAEGVIHSIVLPGFQFRQRDLLHRPSLETLALDEVYQSYVLRSYQAAIVEAEAEQQRADAAESQAKAEQARADAAEAQLAQLQAELAQLRANAT